MNFDTFKNTLKHDIIKVCINTHINLNLLQLFRKRFFSVARNIHEQGLKFNIVFKWKTYAEILKSFEVKWNSEYIICIIKSIKFSLRHLSPWVHLLKNHVQLRILELCLITIMPYLFYCYVVLYNAFDYIFHKGQETMTLSILWYLIKIFNIDFL